MSIEMERKEHSPLVILVFNVLLVIIGTAVLVLLNALFIIIYIFMLFGSLFAVFQTMAHVQAVNQKRRQKTEGKVTAISPQESNQIPPFSTEKSTYNVSVSYCEEDKENSKSNSENK
jgi:ABC-type multidrug transport system permease subunit